MGGCVRDLLLKTTPKDFDIATSATPNQVKKLFKNCRLIGKRFRLAHLFFKQEIFEVATFRGNPKQEIINATGQVVSNNIYGSIEEDAKRRDFTINSLYYDPVNKLIIDLCGGMQDIKKLNLQIIGNLKNRLIEDPIIILRAIRFQAKLNCHLKSADIQCIKKSNHLLKQASEFRLLDDLIKALHCGKGQSFIKLLMEYETFAVIFPSINNVLKDSSNYKLVMDAIQNTDSRINANNHINQAFIFAALYWPLLTNRLTQHKKNNENVMPIMEIIDNTLKTIRQEISITKKFAMFIKSVWYLQFGLESMQQNSARKALQHEKFRAAYDFLSIRAQSNPKLQKSYEFWSVIQKLSNKKQQILLSELPKL